MPRPHGVTSLRILAAIRDRATYGLEIVAETDLPSGTVYPTLGRLRRKGLVKARWERQERADDEGRPRRRYYELTPEGARVLRKGVERIRGIASELGAARPEGAA